MLIHLVANKFKYKNVKLMRVEINKKRGLLTFMNQVPLKVWH